MPPSKAKTRKKVARKPSPEKRDLAELQAIAKHLAASLSVSTAGPEDALHRAQDLVYDAWDAPTPKRRVALARQALELSPLCADAFVILAQHANASSEEELELWRRGVAAGEQAIGKELFAEAEAEGGFWGMFETRPYMRARLGLALALWRRGRGEEALDHARELLRLNPGDNQGIRYLLSAWLIETDRDDELASLLKRYPAEIGHGTWTMALASFRRAGDSAESRRHLAIAMDANRHVAAGLLGERKLKDSDTGYLSVGGEDEAAFYVRDFGNGWRRTPGALDWLRRNAAALAPVAARKRKPPKDH